MDDKLNEQYMAFLIELKISKNQEVLMETLRTMGYHFYTLEHLNELGVKLKPKPQHLKRQWMAKRVFNFQGKEEKLDPDLVFGIRLLGDAVDTVKIYYNAHNKGLEFYTSWNIPWPNNHKVNFKKPKIKWKFPKPMSHDERKKWRKEHFILLKDPTKIPTDFYKQWKPDIQAL